MTGALIAFRNDRLGARLISLVNALRVGERLGLPVKVHWITTSGVGSEFNDPTEFFSKEFVRQYFIPAEEWRKRKAKLKSLSEVSLDPEKLALAVQKGTDVLFGMAFGLTVLEGEEVSDVASQCGEIFRNLPLAKPLLPIVDRIRGGLANGVAYHIRRGDLIKDIRARNKSWPHKFVPDAFYLKHMRSSISTGKNVVLFSDTQSVVDGYQAEFPEIRTLAQLVDLENLPQGARDYLDLYSMSCCAMIIAPEASAFSSTASVLGGTPKIDVKQELSPDQMAEIGSDLFDQAISGTMTGRDVGEFAQIIPHIAEQLLSVGRHQDAARLYEKVTLEDRVPASFLYAQAMQTFVETGRVDLAERLGEILPECPIYHERDRLRCGLSHAAASAALGDTVKAFEAMRNLLAYSYDAGQMKRVLPLLAIRGALKPQVFFPVTASALCLGGRVLKLASLDLQERLIVEKLAPGPDAPVRGTAELFGLDWYPVLLKGRDPAVFLADQKRADAVHGLFAKADTVSPEPEILGLAGLARVYLGERSGLDLMKSAIQEMPENPLIWHRLAHGNGMLREWRAAVSAAVELVKLADSPAYQACAARLLQRDPAKRPMAREVARAAVAAGWNFAPFHSILAELEVRCGDHEAARIAASEAARLMPTAANRVTEAKLAGDLGDRTTATRILHDLWEDRKLPRPSYVVLCKLLCDAGQIEVARSVLADATETFADQEGFLKRVREAVG